jgi:UDP-N-acetylmuramate--alanine ligase
VGIGLDIPLGAIREAFESFRGVDRRFQVIGRSGGITVVDDYGHHPTEIRATLAAARQCGFRRIHVIFQPHRYTRTRDLAEEFAGAFTAADTVHLLDIYAASEPPIPGVTAEALASIVRTASGKAAYAASFEAAVEAVSAGAAPGDLVLTLGAGNVSHLAPQVLDCLSSRANVTPSEDMGAGASSATAMPRPGSTD